MLHFTIARQRMGEMHYRFTQKDEVQKDILQAEPSGESEEDDGADTDNDWLDYEREHQQEEILMQCIRDGNMNYREAFGKSAVTPLDTKRLENNDNSPYYMFVTLIMLCARAAIEGGVPPKTARAMQYAYIRKAEQMKTVSDLRGLVDTMFPDFIRHVNEAKNKSGVSQPIRECCDYIKAHFMDELSLTEIARNVGYTEYYLTRKFNQEMGIRLLDYIKDTRLEYAKVYLLSTDKSIQDISDDLHFGSRNYFTKVFKEKMGLSPADFRSRQSIQGPQEKNKEHV